MAEATYALADECDDPDMMRDYLDLGARWILAAQRPAPRHTRFSDS
jgi:hypothetical protein